MITKELYEKALKIIEQYRIENNIDVEIGDKYKYLEHYSSGGKKPDLTVGKIYEVLKIKPKYRFHRIAVAIRDDNNVLRWYSFDRLKKAWEKIKEKA